MKVRVLEEECISCGLCIDTCPEVFEWDDDEDKARPIQEEVPEGQEDCAREAIDLCPTEAIEEIV